MSIQRVEMKIRSGDLVKWNGELCRVGTELDEHNVTIGQRIVPVCELTFEKREWVSSKVSNWLYQDYAGRLRSLQKIVSENESKFRPDFIAVLPQNAHLFSAALTEVIKLKNAGHEHYSMRTIIEYLRHHTATKSAGGEFKVNNNYAPALARLMVLMFPELDTFFAIRSRVAA